MSDSALLPPDLLICAGEKREKISLFSREFEIRLISAYDAAVCLRDAKKLEKRLKSENIDDSEALAHNACLASLCLYDGIGRVFESGDEALLRLTADELAQVAQSYAELRKSDLDIDSIDGADIERLREKLASSPLSRIRWKVQKAFCRLPSETAVKRMTDGQYLYCYLNLLIDEAEEIMDSGYNESFEAGDGDDE